MLFEEIVAVYCENQMEHTDTVCGQDKERGKLGGDAKELKENLF
jgi:hypothetical protein